MKKRVETSASDAAKEIDNVKLTKFMYEVAKKAQSSGGVGSYSGWGLIANRQEYEQIAKNFDKMQALCNANGRIIQLRWSSLNLDDDRDEFAVKLRCRISS